MSNSDSFIDEVTEEVRREKLYGYLRRYGWIAVACVLLLVGGAAFNEYRNAQAGSAAEATGDALLEALNENEPAARAARIAEVQTEGAAAAVTALLTAATQQETGEIEAAHATLSGVVTNADIPPIYKDLAAIKAAMLPIADTAAREASLDALSQPGQPFRLLALEQLAYLALERGETDAALTTLRQIEEDASVTRGLRERVQSLMVALGEPLPEPETQTETE
ncbi:tetratricopeptide repeat protein [Yoonia sp. SS1-5]|uniref:Tetratricopeptide repeat protein n=1 Tax=Yoonia rhodophyticola TaxID=3137370 RepID=A0AAN0M6I0_9RHOB